MNYIRLLLRFKAIWILALLTVAATPVLAQPANFGTLRLAPGFKPSEGTVAGYTGGSYSLSAIANRDRDNKACIGFGDPTPDHIMVLQKDFDDLKLQVNSGGYDTTLIVQGPDDNTIRCGDDTGQNKDASIDANNLKAGTYRIWVGTFDAGVKHNYTFSVRD